MESVEFIIDTVSQCCMQNNNYLINLWKSVNYFKFYVVFIIV